MPGDSYYAHEDEEKDHHLDPDEANTHYDVSPGQRSQGMAAHSLHLVIFDVCMFQLNH